MQYHSQIFMCCTVYKVLLFRSYTAHGCMHVIVGVLRFSIHTVHYELFITVSMYQRSIGCCHCLEITNAMSLT